MLYFGTDPESYLTEYTLVYEETGLGLRVYLSGDTQIRGKKHAGCVRG